MAKAKGNTLPASLSEDTFPALRESSINNLTYGERLNVSDIPRIKVPTGGLNKWVLEAFDGPQTINSLEGIIISQALIRALYARPFEETGGVDSPACFSHNSISGHFDRKIQLPDSLRIFGEPSENCSMCPFSQYGTRIRGGGQACQQRRVLLLITKESSMPVLVSIPPSGLHSAKRFMLGLASLGLEFWQVVTELTLVEARNKDGIRYSKPVFNLSERLPQSMFSSIQKYKSEVDRYISLSYAATDTPTTSLEAKYPALPPVTSIPTFQEIRA